VKELLCGALELGMWRILFAKSAANPSYQKM
jgi:hypothetical protein